jgi:hypothetical protein
MVWLAQGLVYFGVGRGAIRKEGARRWKYAIFE